MDKKYILAIDQSTQGTKAILFDASGCIVGRSDLSHRQIINEKGWVSHDLTEIYLNTLRVVKDVVEKTKIDRGEIACLGISNQRETSAAWHRTTGDPLAEAIVWQCSRAEEICERIKKNVIIDAKRENDSNGGVSEIIRHKTGIQLSAYFPAAKFAWLLENVAEVKAARDSKELCLGTIDTWLLYKLTDKKVYATDYSNASRTQLFNINSLEWDQEICSWFGINPNILPMVCDSNFDYGETDFEGYLDKPIPIYGVIGDSQGALLGQGCIEKGMIKATYGTGSSVMMNVGHNPVFSESGLVTSLAWGIDNTVSYVLEGNINYSGAVITWLKDDLGLISTPAETEQLALLANKNDTAYLIPAFSGLGAPYWKPEAKALIYGMSRTTGKKEIVKAALESIAYQIKDVVEAMNSINSIEVKELCVDGGPTQNEYLMQFQSNILNTCVKLPKCEESSAYGAAIIAGIKFGFYKYKDLFDGVSHKKYMPNIDDQTRIHKYQGWQEAISHV